MLQHVRGGTKNVVVILGVMNPIFLCLAVETSSQSYSAGTRPAAAGRLTRPAGRLPILEKTFVDARGSLVFCQSLGSKYKDTCRCLSPRNSARASSETTGAAERTEEP